MPFPVEELLAAVRQVGRAVQARGMEGSAHHYEVVQQLQREYRSRLSTPLGGQMSGRPKVVVEPGRAEEVPTDWLGLPIHRSEARGAPVEVAIRRARARQLDALSKLVEGARPRRKQKQQRRDFCGLVAAPVWFGVRILTLGRIGLNAAR